MPDREPHPPASPPPVRFEWLDGVRGMAIIWITFFHCMLAYDGGFPWPVSISSFPAFLDQCARSSAFGGISCAIEGVIAGVLQRGAQGVGVFVLFSGFGLTYSLVKRGGAAPPWGSWYKHRLLRLFPVYWLAHFVILLSPIQYKPDPIDYRFLLSLLGDRVYPVDKMFFYLAPAWWFIGLLLQLYIVFPLLFRLMQRLGEVKYLALCVVLTAASRYLVFGVLEANGNYVQGAFFACRLWEFAAGMAFAKLMARAPGATLAWLLSWRGFAAGVFLYAMSVLSYRPDFLYSFSDGLSGMGLSIILMHAASGISGVPGLGKAFSLAGMYSYGIYLFHQPFVMFAGDKLRAYPMWVFLTAASAVIVAVASASMGLEYAVNRVGGRYRAKRPRP